jgi:hypothetical protein
VARTEIVRITCDICGAVIDTAGARGERVFAVDGQKYMIDLCMTHTVEFDNVMAPFTEAGRSTGATRASRPSPRRRPSRSAASGGSPREIREWARANGFAQVSGRGRVPGEILAAYQAAHGGSAGSPDGQAAASASLAASNGGGDVTTAPAGSGRRARKSGGAPRRGRVRKATSRKAAPAGE